MNQPFADAVIVAAGASGRMAGVDKLDADLEGKALLAWSIDAMASASSVKRIIVVARAERRAELARAPWLRGATLVAGGERRTDSVRAGVEASAADVVLVHDGARPLVSPDLVDAVALSARENGAAVPVVSVADSLKQVAGRVIVQGVERSGLARAQTPQGARRGMLLDALAAAGEQSFSDEAALLESRGVTVAIVPGEAANLKVTEPADLDLVRSIAAGRMSGTRIGLGQDSHGFGPGDGLWLGGVLIEGAPRLYGHSDGDVVLHALATAILSALGLGDLGQLYPASDETTEGISSTEMLAAVLERAGRQGGRVAYAQVAMLGARPKLGSRGLDQIRSRVAELLHVPAGAVAVTASTGNLNGAEGAGRVISATALVGIHRG